LEKVSAKLQKMVDREVAKKLGKPVDFEPSDPKIQKLLKRRSEHYRKLSEQIGEAQAQCEHEWERLLP